MDIFVSVKTNAGQEKVEKIDETHFKVWVNQPAKEGKANKAVINLLAKALGIPKSRLIIIKGQKSRQKIIRVFSSS